MNHAEPRTSNCITYNTCSSFVHNIEKVMSFNYMVKDDVNDVPPPAEPITKDDDSNDIKVRRIILILDNQVRRTECGSVMNIDTTDLLDQD